MKHVPHKLFDMPTKLNNKNYINHFSILLNTFVCISIILLLGADSWAELTVEYFDRIKKISDISIQGWAGYFSLIPQVASVVYHVAFVNLLSVYEYSRLVTSLILFISVYFTFDVVKSSPINPTKQIILIIIIELSLFALVHQSVYSLITASYFLYVPFLINVIAGGRPKNGCRITFVAALLTKPSLYFIVPLIVNSKYEKFKLVCLILGATQILLSNEVLNLNFSFIHLILIGADIFKNFFMYLGGGAKLLAFAIAVTFFLAIYLQRLKVTIYFIVIMVFSMAPYVRNFAIGISYDPANLSKMQYLIVPNIIFVYYVVSSILIGVGHDAKIVSSVAIKFTNAKRYICMFVYAGVLLIGVALLRIFFESRLNQINMNYVSNFTSQVEANVFEGYHSCYPVPPFFEWDIQITNSYQLKPASFVHGGCKNGFLDSSVSYGEQEYKVESHFTFIYATPSQSGVEVKVPHGMRILSNALSSGDERYNLYFGVVNVPMSPSVAYEALKNANNQKDLLLFYFIPDKK
jgi:hypothetical protein